MPYQQERLALFIDGANLYATTRQLGFDIDFRRLRDTFATRGRLVRALYFTAILDSEEHSPIRPLVDWLQYNGFVVATKPAREHIDANGIRRVKGNMDVEMAVLAMELAPRIDHAVIFSGDGDLRALVEGLQRQGVRVTVASSMQTQPPAVADDLRRQADTFLDLTELRQSVMREPRTRPGLDLRVPAP
ncbi:NYN domain-containing protein [Falsirhodobacter algicola]|uniref:NYN domain-containing protein n=1 Tax=Falsirhodobacter algicola TaxID=2692330 RepID=A0A8J8MTQ7_9RHOB|nr:NYN domain-containing protein [Falsirhodobacter algicola]QUS36515.1 NYN domain-containing protein [Falsirhodobacter algicola]